MLCLRYFVGLKVVLNDGDKNRLQEDLRDESPVLINKSLVTEQLHNCDVKEKIRSLKNDYLSNSYYEKTNPSTKEYQPDIVNEKFIKRLIIPLKQLSIDTFSVLNMAFMIIGVEPIDKDKLERLEELEEILKQVKKYLINFRIFSKVNVNRNSKIDLMLDRYFEFNTYRPSDWNIEHYIDGVFIDLNHKLKKTSTRSLFNSLIIAVKDYGQDKSFGIISLVLFMFSLKLDGKIIRYREFLKYSLVFFKCLNLNKCKTNADIENANDWELKNKLYKIMFKCLFPTTHKAKYEEISHLLVNTYGQNKWFNEPQVFLLLYYNNTNNISEFYFMFRNINFIENLHDRKIFCLAKLYYESMQTLFSIESILLNNIKICVN